MENENRPPQPEAPRPLEFEAALHKQDLEFALRMRSKQFDVAKAFAPQETLPPDDEDFQKILKADTRLRQRKAYEKTQQSYDNEVSGWTNDLINEINTDKKDHPEQIAILKKIFGDDVEKELRYNENNDEATQKDITDRREKLAKEFRLRFFDPQGRELQDANFSNYLKQIYKGEQDLSACIQRDYNLLQTLTIKLFGSDLRLINFALEVSKNTPVITQRLTHGDFQSDEQLNDQQKGRLTELQEAQKYAAQRERQRTLESPVNTQRTLDLAQHIIKQQNQDIFLRHFILPEQIIPIEGDATTQLDTWFLSHLGRHVTTKEHEQYIVDGQLRTSLEDIKQDILNTTEYQDKAVTRESLLHLYKTIIEPAQLTTENVNKLRAEFAQYFYATSMLGLPLEEIRSRFLDEVTKDYEQKMKNIKKDTPNAQTDLELLTKKIKDHKDAIEEDKKKIPLRKTISDKLRQLYDGEVHFELIEKLAALPDIQTLAQESTDSTTDTRLITSIFNHINTNADYQSYKTLLDTRLDEINRQKDVINQILGEDTRPISLPGRRKVEEAINHPNFAQAIANRNTINISQLETYRAGNLLFAFDPNLPDIADRVKQFSDIAAKRAKTMGQHQRDRQPIVVLMLSDDKVLESQTSADGQVILMNYGDSDSNQAERIAKQQGQFAHELTHAITYQQQGQTPVFAINEASAYDSERDFTTDQSWQKLESSSPFRSNISDREKQGYLLAGFVYDLIRKYAANPQQAKQIFNTVAYNEAARWNLSLNHAQFTLKSGKEKSADNVDLISHGIPQIEGPSFTVKEKNKEIQERPPITNIHLMQHIYSLLGRDFKFNFVDGENKDLTNYIHNQKFVHEQDEQKQRQLLAAAFNQPINFSMQEYQQQLRGAA